MAKDGFKRTWILVAMGATIACFAIWGCVERAEIAKTLEAAESQVLVEDARTEAETAADIAKMNAVVELGCWIGAGICGFLVGLGIYLRSKSLVIISGLAAGAFITEAVLLTAKSTHSTIIAWVGLAVILIPIATFVVVVIVNRKETIKIWQALTQVVLGNENYKGRLVGSHEIFSSEHEKIQTPTTTKIVDKIRKGGSK